MKSVIDSTVVIQIAIVVRDIEETKKKWAEFLGLPVPPTTDAGTYEVAQTWYNGGPAPKANCLLAFFKVGTDVTLEFLQPNGYPSVWQDHLDKVGEGIQHIAFGVKGIDDKIVACEKFGMKLVQKGFFREADGCYAYMDANDSLKITLELLEFYNQ